jgi:predicted metal-dependent phosphoesterase TrpH
LLRADLHCHSSSSRDSLMTPTQIIHACLKRHVDCIAITDHNQLDIALEVEKQAPFAVILGEEIATPSGELIGLFLKERIRPGLSPRETAERIREQGGLVCVPHPFDRVRRSPLAIRDLDDLVHRDLVDMLEVFNSRVTLPADNVRAVQYASRFALAPSAGSDSHCMYEIGHAFVLMDPFDGPNEFMASLRRGHVQGRLSPLFVHLASQWAKNRRRLTKILGK